MTPAPIARYLAHFGKAPAPSRPADLVEESFPEPALSPPAAEDITAQIEAAYARGAEEARAAAGQDFVAKLLALRLAGEAQREKERAGWVEQEGARLAEQLRTGFIDLEIRLASSVERILKPFLAAALRQQVIEALHVNLSVLLSDQARPAMRISGPPDLLAALAKRLETSPRAIEYVTSDGVDVVIVADETIIESRLRDWLARFDIDDK